METQAVLGDETFSTESLNDKKINNPPHAGLALKHYEIEFGTQIRVASVVKGCN